MESAPGRVSCSTGSSCIQSAISPHPLPPIDLNADGKLDLLDYQQFLTGLHADLSDLTAAQAYALGDLNGDFQNNFFDLQAFSARLRPVERPRRLRRDVQCSGTHGDGIARGRNDVRALVACTALQNRSYA